MGWTKPLCSWHLPELCGIPVTSEAISVHRSTTPLLGFRLHRRPNRTELAGRTSASDTSHGLPFPTAHAAWEIHLPRALPARYGPPPGFGHPLDSLRPPGPRRPCFVPAALLGFSLRSVPLSKGCRRCSQRGGPAYRFSRRSTPCPKAKGRCAEPRFPGFNPPESPWRPHLGVAGRYAGCSPGIHPPRVLHQTACQRFRPGSSHTLRGNDLAEPADVPESQWLSDWPW